jgi:hypothetical protein
MPTPAPADHARHDLDLIAGHAAGDLIASDLVSAENLLATCDTCSSLRRDLVAIASATRALPAPATTSRDFRIDPTQADALRRGSWLRGLLRPFGAPRSSLRPVAAAFTSLGVAGLLVATVGVGFLGSAASGLAPEFVTTGGQTTQQTAAPIGIPGRGLEQDASNAPGNANYGPAGQPTREILAGAGKSDDAATNAPPVAVAGGSPPVTEDLGLGRSNETSRGPNFLVLASLGLIAFGMALFALRFVARRVR